MLNKSGKIREFCRRTLTNFVSSNFRVTNDDKVLNISLQIPFSVCFHLMTSSSCVLYDLFIVELSSFHKKIAFHIIIPFICFVCMSNEFKA
jgi:hypothetical protein